MKLQTGHGMVSIALLQAGSSGKQLAWARNSLTFKEGRRVKLFKCQMIGKTGSQLLLTVICPILPHLTTEISKPPSVYSQPTQCIIPYQR